MRLAILLATFSAVLLLAAAADVRPVNSALCQEQSPGSAFGSISCFRELRR